MARTSRYLLPPKKTVAEIIRDVSAAACVGFLIATIWALYAQLFGGPEWFPAFTFCAFLTAGVVAFVAYHLA